MPTLLFAALGSMGDVLFALQLALHRAHLGDQIVFFTHSDHISTFRHVHPEPAMRFRSCGTDGQLNSDLDHVSKHTRRQIELARLAECRSLDFDLVVFNLFALEAHALAEAADVGSIAVSPFLPTHRPFAMPPTLWADIVTMTMEAADATDAVDAADSGEQGGTCPAVESARPVNADRSNAQTAICPPDFRLWIWRLCLDDIGRWRTSLGLPESVVSARQDHGALEYPDIPLLLPMNSRWAGSVPGAHVLGHFDPGQVFGRAEYAETNESEPPSNSGPETAEHDPILAFVNSNPQAPKVFVTFGSMETLCPELAETHSPQPGDGPSVLCNFVRKVAFAMRLAGCHVLWQVTAGSPLTKALQSAASDHIRVWDRPVSHSKYLPLFNAAVHHGGAGIVAACLCAGIKQIVVPLMFDQFDWAEKVQSEGVGRSLDWNDTTLVDWGDAIAWSLDRSDLAALERWQSELDRDREEGVCLKRASAVVDGTLVEGPQRRIALLWDRKRSRSDKSFDPHEPTGKRR
ncbi:uncharacterized protein BJ171DRAFT_582813 [Polychytrium aggregatum]|uniref:uncharacterized protein n=1 Tax=Polychytrium aggregatum TaxID=110093 RepID=UPI0022FDEBE1|nr:uncharacterized protein BJ171DRAFT_582813 [Polychytrium aggregatum]KAI9203668.1 hypothetical protein BJ171DRAFT_582813 [Polychytrium aggregatum]